MTRVLSVLLLLLAAGLPAVAPARGGDPAVSVIGLIGDRAILRINGEQAILRSGESRDDVTLLRVEKGEAVLLVGKREVRLGMGMDTGGIAPREPGGSIEIAMTGNGQFIANGMINGRVVEFLVDTGANSVSMTAEDARQLGIDYRIIGKQSRSATAGGIVVAWVVTLKSVQVGPIVVKNVVATVREAPRHSPILLGMTFLSQVDLRQERNRLRLTAR
ncbi:MAG: hypothetical protein K0Q68_1644 [Moraxellaceae bacterium]|jgi:aspartyl protease family protein|nr:hypothetical protein [Moraxellaceae bacterium]